jgi:hypothetical protein
MYMIKRASKHSEWDQYYCKPFPRNSECTLKHEDNCIHLHNFLSMFVGQKEIFGFAHFIVISPKMMKIAGFKPSSHMPYDSLNYLKD